MLAETSTLVEITSLPLESAVQVKWRNTIEKDGEVVSAKEHYKLYTAEQKDDFLSEVEGAAGYVAVLGW